MRHKLVLPLPSPNLSSAGRSWLLAASVAGSMVVSARAETHARFQAVTETGTSSWTGDHPVTLVGVLLTDPEEMLDATPNFLPWNDGANQFRLGAEWQVAVQATLADDHGGTFLYMGQNYGNMPWHRSEEFSYTDEAWSAEITRLNHDPATGRAFRQGDLVSITAHQSAFYGGKRNVNETHDIDPEADFTVTLIIPDYGLPTPVALSLASLVRPDDNDPATREDIFDPTRQSGGERWQSTRVRLTGLTLVNSEGWTPEAGWGQRLSVATDGEGRIFPLRHPRYTLGPAPTGRFDAIGVLNQESGSGTDGTFGYELFVQEIAPASDPELNIALKPVITWPGSLTNYRLESTASLTEPEWLPVPSSPVLIDGLNTIINEDATQKFFRLERFQ